MFLLDIKQVEHPKKEPVVILQVEHIFLPGIPFN